VGDPDMLSDVDLGGDGHIGTMGLGGGGMTGMFGSRGGGCKKRAVVKYGGKGTLTAVDRGLEWLRRHQNPDGSWGPQSYVNQCKGANTKCRDGIGTYAEAKSRPSLTGLAAMCFLGAGFTHKSGQYKKVVKKALEFILSQQQASGGFAGKGGYSPGFCTLALAEAYGMTRDPKLKKPLELAVHYLIEVHQVPGLAWRYRPGQGCDSSVTAAIVMALKDASISGIKGNYKKAFDGAKNWFKQASRGEHNGIGMYIKSAWWTPNTTAIMMLCHQFMGMKRTNPTMKESLNYLMEKGVKCELNEPHMYYIYYASLAIFQNGGKEWRKWNKEMKKILLETQAKGGCVDGSWGINHNQKLWWDPLGGRVFSTTLAILTLEVYYRYSPLFR